MTLLSLKTILFPTDDTEISTDDNNNLIVLFLMPSFTPSFTLEIDMRPNKPLSYGVNPRLNK